VLGIAFGKKEDRGACMQSLFTTGAACFDDNGRFPTEAGVAQIEGELEKPAAGGESTSSSSSCSSSSLSSSHFFASAAFLSMHGNRCVTAYG
jgi:hypothetical protein